MQSREKFLLLIRACFKCVSHLSQNGLSNVLSVISNIPRSRLKSVREKIDQNKQCLRKFQLIFVFSYDNEYHEEHINYSSSDITIIFKLEHSIDPVDSLCIMQRNSIAYILQKSNIISERNRFLELIDQLSSSKQFLEKW